MVLAENVEVFVFKAYVGADGSPALAAVPDKRRVVSAAARDFVRVRVAQLTGRRHDSLIFSAGAHGKPYIEDSPVHFNLSHCGNVVIAAFSESEVGADIELIARGRSAVVQKKFTQGERDYIAVAPSEKEANRRFYEIWTAKEAFLKLYGVGLSGGLEVAAADGSGLYHEMRSEALGSAEVFRRRVNVELNRSDFVPKLGEIYQNVEEEFQICICGKHLGEVTLQILE